MRLRHALPARVATMRARPEQHFQVHHVVDDHWKAPRAPSITAAIGIPRLDGIDGRIEPRRKRPAGLHHDVAIVRLVGEQVPMTEAVEDHEAEVMRGDDALVGLEPNHPSLGELPPLRIMSVLVHVPEGAGEEATRPLIDGTLLPASIGARASWIALHWI